MEQKLVELINEIINRNKTEISHESIQKIYKEISAVLLNWFTCKWLNNIPRFLLSINKNEIGVHFCSEPIFRVNA